MDAGLAHLIYGLGWLSFGLVHSILATPAIKRHLAPVFGARYRLSYNLFAVLYIAIVWGFGSMTLDAQPFALEPGIDPALTAVRWLGIIVLVLAVREYDLGRFSGLSQLRARCQNLPDPGDERLVTQGLHRFARRPLYLGAHMILWGGAVNEFGLATAAWGSLYLVVGARHEETALLALYGDAYASYLRQVPAPFPWKGKAL